MVDRPYELAPTDELLDELLLRHDHAAFIGMKCGVRHQSDARMFARRYTGEPMMVVGLCLDMALMTHKSFEQKATTGDEESRPEEEHGE